MLRLCMLGCAFVCSATASSHAQAAPSEYVTFTSHGKAVSCPVYASGESINTLIFLHGTNPDEIRLGREEAQFFAAHGYRVLLPEYVAATRTEEATAANYKRWAEVVEDILADLHSRSMPQNKKIALAGQGVGASVALIAAAHPPEVQAVAAWSGLLPNQFFSQVQHWPPLLILHGELDEQVPIVNARQLVRLCQLKDLTCETQIYAGEGHQFSPRIIELANQRVLAFFHSYLR